MKKFLKIIYNLAIAGLVVLSLLLIVPVLPIPGNYQVRVVLSGSMEPAIKTGSVIFMRPASSYETGDIITFADSGFKDDKGRLVPVTHRVLEVRPGEFGTSFMTKGDANESADFTLVRQENVLGRVFLTIPYLGYGVETARQPRNFMILIIIPSAIIVFDQIKKIILEAKRLRRKEDISESNNI